MLGAVQASVALIACSPYVAWVCLLLEHHLLFDLLFMELLGRCQIEVVYYVCDVGHTVVVGSPSDTVDLAILLLAFCRRWMSLVLLMVVAAAV